MYVAFCLKKNKFVGISDTLVLYTASKNVLNRD